MTLGPWVVASPDSVSGCLQGKLDWRGPVQNRPALLRVPAQLRRRLQEQPVLPR